MKIGKITRMKHPYALNKLNYQKLPRITSNFQIKEIELLIYRILTIFDINGNKNFNI